MKYTYVILILFILSLPTKAFAAGDTDHDGLTDEEENMYATDINNPDTDGDGFKDGQEVFFGYSPLVGDMKRLKDNDFDKDGLTDAQEIQFGTKIRNIDSDSDGYADNEEVWSGHNPNDAAKDAALFREIVVDLTHQQLSVMVDHKELVKFPVSTGLPRTPTPPGTYSVIRKIPVVRYIGPGYNLPNTKWNLEFIPKYFMHTAYWHNDFGFKTASHGCVNMREQDVAILYKYIPIGVQVRVIGKTPVNGKVAVN